MYGFRDGDLFKLVAVLIVLGMVGGWVVFDGLPLLWELVKPWVHGVTR